LSSADDPATTQGLYVVIKVDIVGEVAMGVVTTGESCRAVSVDRPWTRVLNHFANNIKG